MTFHGMHVPGTPSIEGGDSIRTADLLPTPTGGTGVADHFRINELLSQLAALTIQRDQYGAQCITLNTQLAQALAPPTTATLPSIVDEAHISARRTDN